MTSLNPIVLFRQWQTWRKHRRARAKIIHLLRRQESDIQDAYTKMAIIYHLYGKGNQDE